MSAVPSAPDPLSAVTAALVESNDRLLGLIGLTGAAFRSLEEDELLDTVVWPTIELLQLEQCTIGGAIERHWTTTTADATTADAHVWQTSRELDSGRLELLVTRSAEPFGTADTKILEAVANLLGNSIRIARMHADRLTQAVVEREHAQAARLTATALPLTDQPPEIDGVDLWVHARPARTTGGDLFTWFAIDDRIWFAVGDVSGKGLPAAVLMSVAVTMVEAAIHRHHVDGIEHVGDATNRWCFQRFSDADMFLTLAVGCIDPATATAQVMNFGHSPVLVVSPAASKRLEASAPPIGVLLDIQAQVTHLQLSEGDTIALGTDGLTEQFNAAGQAFGEDPFDTLLHASACSPDAATLGQTVLAAVDSHAGGTEQSDDQTLMLVRYSPAARTSTSPQLTIDATHLALRTLGPWLAGALNEFADQGLIERCGEIELALHEVATNVVDHAYAGGADGDQMTIDLRLIDNKLIARICDQGRPFVDPGTRPDPDDPQVRGYGLMIVEQLASTIEQASGSYGNRWTLSFESRPVALPRNTPPNPKGTS